MEIVKAFSTDCYVYALCRSKFPTADLSDNIKVVSLDVTDESAIKTFAKQLEEKEVAVDLLINNAGIAGVDGSDNVKVDAESIEEVFATNTIAPMMLSLYLTPHLKKSEHPVMIAISSIMGTHAKLDTYNAEWWPYSASKAALSLAVSAFAINQPAVKSISVRPGWVKTRMGGEGADIEPSTAARCIRNLYESVDTLTTGNLYNYDGHVLDW